MNKFIRFAYLAFTHSQLQNIYSTITNM